MLKLFAVPPDGKGKEAWSKIDGIGCIHSRDHRAPFYFSQVTHKRGMSLRDLLLGLGYICAQSVVQHPGLDRNTAIGNRMLERIQFAAISGTASAHEAVTEARAILPALRITYVDGDGLPRRGSSLYAIQVPRDFKCDPKILAQYIIFLVGFWGYIKEGVKRCSRA